MWIRSQDRKVIVNINEVYLYEKNNLTIRGNGNSGFYLGKYETEERAMEVLDEIQNAICESEVWVRQRNIQGFENSYNKYKTIYEMPKE